MYVLSSCCKPDIRSATFVENNTSHKIELSPYKNGTVVNEGLVIVEKSATQEISANSYVAVNALSDSIEIIFDSSKKLVHYSEQTSKIGNNPNAVTYNEPRNLFNGTDFISLSKSFGCGGSYTTHTYTFTEQDYLNAK